MKEAVAVVASLIAVAGNVPYLRAIGRGVEPHPYTWALGALVTGIAFTGIVVKGGGVGAWPVGVSFLFTFAIFLYSLRYGAKHIVAADTALLAVAIAGLVPWYYTQDPTLSVVIAVCVDVLSFVPTVRKTWRYPRTEAPVLYAANMARHALVLVALESYVLATTLHSVVMIIINAGMVALILVRRKVDATIK